MSDDPTFEEACGDVFDAIDTLLRLYGKDMDRTERARLGSARNTVREFLAETGDHVE